jgi:2',5'-phosphodiesterase
VLAKLEEQVATRAIICLQEVSLSWSGPLHAFFAAHQFHFVFANYGSFFSGYFGVGLAFPISTFEALDIKIERLTDAHRWPQRPQPTGVVKFVADLRTRVTGVWNALFGDLDAPKKSRRGASADRARPSDVWHQSRDRRNMLIFARLRCKANGARLCVGTYHMPCAFYSPPTMLIHSALAVRRFQDCCADDPGVLAGDFNIKPQDSSYDMITTGNIDSKHSDFPAPGPDGSPATLWMPALRNRMKSAYREVLGHEPDFTNYAQIEENPAFIDTLDYIFCSEEVDVVDVVRLPHRSVINGPYPIRSEPSDHSLIGATLRLPAASSKATRKGATSSSHVTTESRK